MRCFCWSLGFNHPRLSACVPGTRMPTQPQLASLHGSWHKHRSPKTGILAVSRYTREVPAAQVAHPITAEFVLSEVPIAQSLGNSRCRQGFCFPRRSQAQAHRNPEKDPRQGTCCEWQHHLLTALNSAVQTPGMQAQVILTRKSIHRSPQLDRLSGGLLELQAKGYH